jgi:hypothetical protein
VQVVFECAAVVAELRSFICRITGISAWLPCPTET